MSNLPFNSSYYAVNCQDRDRPALRFYTRLAKRYFLPGRVLDFGCGTGFFMKRLSSFFSVDGFEVSAHGVEKSKMLLPKTRIFTDLNDIPSAGYSGITALHVLEHIKDEDIVSVCNVWRSVLRPGGKVLCVMPELEGLGHRIKKQDWIGLKDPTHINLKTREEWRALFEKNGFKVIVCGTDGLWDFPYSKKLPKFLDLLINAPATVVQYLAGRLLLKPGMGESMIAVLEPSESGSVRLL